MTFIRERTIWSQLRYSLYLIFHPFDGFWDLKHEKRGSIKSATIILGLVAFSKVAQSMFTGFLYRDFWDDGVSVNIFSDAATIAATFLLFCVANWALTTLMNGEGSFGDIYMVSAYALVPLVLINIPMALLSNVMTLELETFYTLAGSIAMVWSGILLLSGLLVVHQYSLGKTIATAVFIVVAMAFIIFLGMLFFNLVGQIIGFISGLYWEITLRL